MTTTSIRRSGSQLAIALCLSLAMGGAALAETTVETNSVLGTYLAARLAQGLRDTDAANALLKVALERDPGNAALLDQAFISEITAGNWQQAVGYATRAVASDPGNHLAHLVLGVDAGNTKTIALVARDNGEILGYGRSGCGDIYGATSEMDRRPCLR